MQCTLYLNLGFHLFVEIPNIFAGALDEAIFCPWIKLIGKYKKINHLESPIKYAFMQTKRFYYRLLSNLGANN